MMRTLCFSFLLLASSQMVIGAEKSKSELVGGNLFGKWIARITTGEKTESRLILNSDHFNHAFVCTSGFMAGVILATGISPLSPILLLAPVSLWAGRGLTVARYNALSEARSKFNGNSESNTIQNLEFDQDRVTGKTWLQSLILPTFIGIAGVVLYGFASRYQFKMLPR